MLSRHEALLDRAAAGVRGRSRVLCASLGLLAQHAAEALGASTSIPRVAEAASLLSLLTKIDDDVIDGQAFHGGPLRTSGHVVLRRRVRSYLAPTLDSLLRGRPARDEARCELAALVGQQLAALASSRARLDALHEVIAAGWETQVRAVDMLSRHPACSTLAEVAHVTAAISAEWLLMITMVGGLPGDARRDVSDAEMHAFWAWGWHIQRADALADFAKDLDEGLNNSWTGRVCFERYGDAYVKAVQRRDGVALDRMVESVASQCVPDARAKRQAREGVAGLGRVGDDLSWIHAMLLGRRHRRRTEAC
ncbi:MAG: hypothetical protein AAGA54_05505 [Myxococcota bacterium]